MPPTSFAEVYDDQFGNLVVMEEVLARFCSFQANAQLPRQRRSDPRKRALQLQECSAVVIYTRISGKGTTTQSNSQKPG